MLFVQHGTSHVPEQTKLIVPFRTGARGVFCKPGLVGTLMITNRCPLSHLCSEDFLMQWNSTPDATIEEAVAYEAPSTSGIVLHSPLLYDLTVWLAFFGKEHRFREKVLQLARISRGESVLDVGCGTGTLAIAAKRRVGPAGSVCGVDASPEMLARAEKKAQT